MEQGPGAKWGIADSLRRLLDQRGEERSNPGSQTAVLIHGASRHVVRLLNLSASGAMIHFGGQLVEGDEVSLQLLDHAAVTGQVRWIRDSRIGISFPVPIDSMQDDQG